MNPLQEITEDFLTQGLELHADLTHLLLILKNNPAQLETLHQISCIIHTLKAQSTFLNYTQLATLAEKFQTIIQTMQSNPTYITTHTIDTLLKSCDSIKSILIQIRNHHTDRQSDCLSTQIQHLSPIQSLTIRFTHFYFAIPIIQICEIIKLHSNMLSIYNSNAILTLNHQPLSIPSTLTYYLQEETPCNAIILQKEDLKLAIPASKVLGQEEITPRPLNSSLQFLEGISGLAILSNQEIASIIDINLFNHQG